MVETKLTEEIWQAIILNNAAYNDQFFYGVKSTGIFCRPSCKSRAPKKENVVIFQKAEEAMAEYFRPCKRCKPTGERLPDETWVAQITSCIETNYREKLTLESLADLCHGSPYHLHRTFKRIIGMTPVEYIQQTRINRAKEYLIGTNMAIAELALAVGMPNTSYFVTLFKKKTGFTPTEYREFNKKGDGQNGN